MRRGIIEKKISCILCLTISILLSCSSQHLKNNSSNELPIETEQTIGSTRDENVEQYMNSIRGYSIKDTITGDFNGDGFNETAWGTWNVNLNIPDYQMDSLNCVCKIIFSDKKIPELNIPWCPFGFPQNEGDLNENGTDEFGILPGWYTSACRNYLLFTLKNGKWIEAINPVPTTLGLRNLGIRLIEKVHGKKGFVKIFYSDDCCCSCECTKDSIVAIQ